MAEDINSVSTLIRREIEALIAAPLIKAYVDELGRDKALEIAGGVIRDLARESGKIMAAFTGGNSIEHLNQALPLFAQGGALEVEIIDSPGHKAALNVTRCRYAEMYRKHGLEDFGFLLSCGRDFELMAGFNPAIKLERTKTIMEGHEYCDFRFSMVEE